MNEFADALKVTFFQGKRLIKRREDYNFSKLSEDGSLYLELTSPKGRALLDILLKADVLQIDGYTYKALGREFFLDGTALFISVEKIEDK